MSQVLLVNACFPPDSVATAQYFHDLARHLVAAGHDVTVLCSRFAYSDTSVAATLTHWPREERAEGCRIVRVGPAAPYASGPRVSRVLLKAFAHGRLFLSMAFAILRLPRFDATVFGTTPALLGVLALPLGRRLGRVVHWTMDLYPEAATRLGAVAETSTVARVTAALSSRAMADAAGVVALGRCMADLLRRRDPPPRRLAIIPPWPIEDATATPEAAESLRHRLVGDAVFAVIYSGNLGRGHDVATLVETILAMAKDRGTVFAFVGGGPGWDELKEKCAGAVNLRFHGSVSRAELPALLGAADVHLVSLKEEAAGVMVPSKFFGVLGAGKPVAYVGPATSEVARVIVEDELGVVVANGDAPGLTAALRRLRDEPETRARMAAAAKVAAVRFERAAAYVAFDRLIHGSD